MTTWGVVATIKAPMTDVLRFAAYHLSLGADQVFLYLDDANGQTYDAVKDHPQVTPVLTDAAWWEKRGRRPDKHQVRQTRNATHCYRRLAKVDWLAHIDVDEFIVAGKPVSTLLSTLGSDQLCARMRPMEQLSGDPTLFKAFIPAGAARHRLVEKIYPRFGPHLKAGFLSHVAGKLFVRLGQDDLKFRIHNVLRGDEMNPGEVELGQARIAHAHARDWEGFLKTFQFRLEQGSYRADLAPERARKDGGQTLHELFSDLHAQEGETGLRAFFDEVCAATPRLIAALEAERLLTRVDLQLDAHVQKHFPGLH
jgi:hypothetical protein